MQISVIGASTELIATMDAEHDIVADALAAEHTAMTRLKSSASSTEAKAAKVAMTRLQQVTVSHFEHEETEMEPISSAHRDAPEVHEIAKRFGKRLTPAKGGRFIAWVLDGASAEGRAAVTRDIPGPVVKIIGGIFGMPYRRNIAPIWRA